MGRQFGFSAKRSHRVSPSFPIPFELCRLIQRLLGNHNHLTDHQTVLGYNITMSEYHNKKKDILHKGMVRYPPLGRASVILARASWKSYLLCFLISLALGGSRSFAFYGTSASSTCWGRGKQASSLVVAPPSTNNGHEASSSYYGIWEPTISPLRHAHSRYSLHTIRGGHVRANLLPAAVASLVSGSVAGAIGVGIAFPLDTLKTKVRI